MLITWAWLERAIKWIMGRKLACVVLMYWSLMDAIDEFERHSSFF